MEKKWWYVVGGATVLVLIIATLLLVQPKKVPVNEWVSQQDNYTVVDVEKATGGRSYIDGSGLQQWKDENAYTAFASDGLYSGEYFNSEYEEEFLGITRMRVTDRMVPEDGIIEGIIVENFEGDQLYANIFIDSDWLSYVEGDINVAWGKDYQNFKAFNFTEVGFGIFYDKVLDDRDRFNEDFTLSSGGVMVGNFTQEQITNFETNGITLIRLS
ncbi:MAG: hypothetical protein KJ601_01075 [Nanoarchaeota archaeon]|nr:hypothetical protein [Nanoarchaeota archaeon]MBU1704978.1 hypothetical protein [Nanoarchaeota archaeon]